MAPFWEYPRPLPKIPFEYKYGKNPPRIVTLRAVERTWQDVPYYRSFIAKSWLNDLEYISQGQRSMLAKHPFMIVISCAKYGRNPPKTGMSCEADTINRAIYSSSIAFIGEWHWRFIIRGQRPLRATHPLMLVIICVKYGKSTSRIERVAKRTRQDMPYISCFTAKSWLNGLEDIGQCQRSLRDTPSHRVGWWWGWLVVARGIIMNNFHSRNLIWNRRLQNGWNFVSAPVWAWAAWHL